MMQKKIKFLIVLLYAKFVCAVDYNVMIVVDNLQQETAKTDEINMTHQCMTALQQQASMVLLSTGLWKNIVDRKKRFEDGLQDPLSVQSSIFNLYKTANQELQSAHYNLNFINQKLSENWFGQKYPLLMELSVQDFNQLKFDFACYIFNFTMSQWRIYNFHEGMLLCVPQSYPYKLADEKFQIFDANDMVKHADKKSRIIESLQNLLVTKKDRFVVYLTGHGHPKSALQGANIAGLKIDEFRKLLDYFDQSMQLKLLMYSSCYGGGVHTVEPYASLQLHYPVIVTAATDAPIFGFGLFEGVKLPPYDLEFKLEPVDVAKKIGLLPCALQNYTAFFKRAWKGQFDLYLVQLLSKFFTCDLLSCHVQKIENFPLIRKSGSLIFVPIKDNVIMKLIQQISGYGSVTVHKPLLLYTKKIKKLKMDSCVPIVSMLPGLQSHTIDQLVAPHILFSQLLNQSFLSFQDMQAYKNFMIKELTCLYDILENPKLAVLKNVVIIGQSNLWPKFVDKSAQVIIYYQLASRHYLLLLSEQKIIDLMELDQNQIPLMQEIMAFVKLLSQQDVLIAPEKLLTFDAYLTSKEYQQKIVEACVKKKVCKKR